LPQRGDFIPAAEAKKQAGCIYRELYSDLEDVSQERRNGQHGTDRLSAWILKRMN
jgi:hypothetical protein